MRIKNILLTFFSLVLLFLLPVGSFSYAHAQTITPAFSDNLEPGTPINSSTQVQHLVIDILGSFNCLLTGYNPATPDHQCLTPNPLNGTLGYNNNSGNLLSGATTLMAYTTLPPIHSTDFVQYAVNNFGVNHAYAATGFESLSPLIGIWSAFRNVVYLLYVLAFVLIGFAIMLRLKIDPRTVMTVQNQLPKIIINLLFVTFSFAIAGLLIDFMWLVTYLMVNLMASIDPQISPVTIGQHLFDNPIGFFNQVIDIPGTALGVGRAFQQVLQGVLHPSDITGISSNGCGSTPFWSGVCNTWNTVSNAFQTAFGWLISWIFGIIGTVIIAIAVIVAMVRLWWALLQAYIYILLNTIIAPFTIFGGLLPGSKAGFGAWMKTMIANIAVFPTVMAVLLLGKSIMDALRNSPGFFQAPLIGQPNSISGSSAHGAIVNPLGMIVGFIILLITPKIVETVKKTIGAADFSAASGIFESIAGAQQLTGGAQKGVGSYLFSEKNDATGRMGGVVTRSLFEHEGIAKLFRRNTYK